MDESIIFAALNYPAWESMNYTVHGISGFDGNGIIYNCEIVNLVPRESESQKPNYRYCKNEYDFEGMGISVIGVYDLLPGKVKYYTEDYFDDFQRLVENRDFVVGFNSIAFDDPLCLAHGISIQTNYDIYREVRVASEQTPWYKDGESRRGYCLERISGENLGQGKPEIRAGYKKAAELWQDGHHQDVIDYCLSIVQLTKALWDKRTELIDPNNGWIMNLNEFENASEDYYLDVLAEAIGWMD